jgi:hypothetical protein
LVALALDNDQYTLPTALINMKQNSVGFDFGGVELDHTIDKYETFVGLPCGLSFRMTRKKSYTTRLFRPKRHHIQQCLFYSDIQFGLSYLSHFTLVAE